MAKVKVKKRAKAKEKRREGPILLPEALSPVISASIGSKQANAQTKDVPSGILPPVLVSKLTIVSLETLADLVILRTAQFQRSIRQETQMQQLLQI